MEKWRFLEIDWLTYAETAIYRPVLMRARSEGEEVTRYGCDIEPEK